MSGTSSVPGRTPRTDTDRLRAIAEDRELCRFLYDILGGVKREQALDVLRVTLDTALDAEAAHVE